MPRHLPVGDAPLSSGPDRAPQPVWDLPVRLFHWTIAALIPFSWWSIHNHHPDWHIWSGAAILTLLIFRLLWGFVGSSTARFANFVRGPRAVVDHLRGRWSGIGHSPLAALSVIALLAALAVQVGLGLIAEDEDGLVSGPLYRFVSTETSDQARNLHELGFNLILGLIVLHLGAVIFYRLRGKPLTKAMITGRGIIDPGTEPMRRGKGWKAVLCLAVGIGITRWVLAGAPPFSP